MSRVSPFFVGMIASGMSYTYLSNKLVKPRNRLMLQHFNAEGVKPYYPHNPREFWRERGRREAGGCPKQREGAEEGSKRGRLPFSSSSVSPSSASPSSSSSTTEHSLVTNARTGWNAAVMRCSDALVGAVYGNGRKDKEGGRGDDGAAS